MHCQLLLPPRPTASRSYPYDTPFKQQQYNFLSLLLLSPFSFLLSPFSFLLSPFSFLLSPFSFLLSPFSFPFPLSPFSFLLSPFPFLFLFPPEFILWFAVIFEISNNSCFGGLVINLKIECMETEMDIFPYYFYIYCCWYALLFSITNIIFRSLRLITFLLARIENIYIIFCWK